MFHFTGWAGKNFTNHKLWHRFTNYLSKILSKSAGFMPQMPALPYNDQALTDKDQKAAEKQMKLFKILSQKIANRRESDQRTHNRIPARYYAYLHAETGAVLSECLVKDISETGAHIILPMAADMPKYIMLRVTGETTPINASIVWQTGTKCGLQFCDASRA